MAEQKFDFEEHNNRKKANKFAEYITGESLRKYLASKVDKYVDKNPTVFDGAAGSGQLEQFIKPSDFIAVEIQPESCNALGKNYPDAKIHNKSFFLYTNNPESDCVVMNPPFSLKLKELSKEEQEAITAEYPWKKSGVVDDVFMLKGLANAKRFGFFIMFPGVGYRNTEKKLREIIGNQLVELNLIQNAFEDTPISVLFLIVDKLKTSNKTYRELYDCKTDNVINSDEWVIEFDRWETITQPIEPKEKINPMELELASQAQLKEHVRAQIKFSRIVFDMERWPRKDFEKFCDELCEVIQFEKKDPGLPPLGMML
nr:MAG TPA: N-6 DNA Methylase [Caudoviricetes sp.]